MKFFRLSIVIIAVFVLGSAKAQNERFEFGVKAGLTSSDIYDVQAQNFIANPKLGLTAGVFLSIPLGKFLGLQPEVLLTQKGFSASGSVSGYTYTFTRTTTYVDIPLLLQLKPIKYITLLAGPCYSYLTAKKDVFHVNNITADQAQAFINNDLRKNTLSAVTGVDLNIRRIVLSGRAGWDLQNNNGDGTTTFPRYRNTWLQGTFGLRF